MNVLIAGGTGLIGTALTRSLLADGHRVWVLTRNPETVHLPGGAQAVGWDGRTVSGWGDLVNQMDSVINLVGESLSKWPWTSAQKQRFYDSRIIPGRALAEAIRQAGQRPKVFIQASGINHYGLHGDEPATEQTSPGDDFLAKLTVAWEASTQPVEDMGVRRVVIRSAVVLAKMGGMFALMSLPVKLYFGGRLGKGTQGVPWIHLDDEIAAIRFLLQDEQASGPFNLVSPDMVTDEKFYRAMSMALHRPYWFPVPAFLLRLFLGEMSVLVLEGRLAKPKRLVDAGYAFRFSSLHVALQDLFA
jgi:uncharacterized protein (TIGR01777 family)